MQFSDLYLNGCKERIVRLCKDIVHCSSYNDDEDFYSLASIRVSEIISILADLIKLGLIEEVRKDETI